MQPPEGRRGSASRMILALDVILEIRTVEIDVAQLARAVALSLIVEVRGRWIATFSACCGGLGVHLTLGKFHYGDEAVAAGAIPLFRSLIGTGAKRGKRAP